MDKIVLAIGSFVGGIFINIVAAALWDFFTGKFSFVTSDYPNLKGRWIATVDLMGEKIEPFDEIIEVNKQFFRKVSGTYLSPSLAEENGGLLELEFQGYLLDHTTLRYVCRSLGGVTVDHVVGMARIASNRREGIGASVSMGMLTDVPAVATVKFKKTS